MIFWDTSALVPLLVREPNTAEVREVLEQDGDVVVWWATPVECLTAVAWREQQGTITPDTANAARGALALLSENWIEIEPTQSVRSYAGNVVLRHELRAADALQLGAAMTWANGQPTGESFFAADKRLSDAARREGFRLVLV